MKTFKTSIETFRMDAMNQKEMEFIIGGGEPKDLIIPPKGSNTGR